ncbi:MAG: hypothetical protein HWD61_00175 [Parachlamydiaceae bacterium]|nr:MAG: hypothetical protein HWD61_00175 [Parachlamydiaceae bacterium]
MSKISTQPLTFCNFFLNLSTTLKAIVLQLVTKKGIFAKIACTILSLGIIPTVCWIVKRYRHKSPENMSQTEKSVNTQGLEILNKERNSLNFNLSNKEKIQQVLLKLR